MSVPVIHFYFPANSEHAYKQFEKLSDEDSARIMRFRNEGFAPVITVQRACPPVDLLGYAWVHGEKELRNDWHDIPFPLVKCLIYWALEIPEKDYFLAKSYFECLLELRDIPKEISVDQLERVNALKPYTEKAQLDESMELDDVDFKLPDGRGVVQVIGGEREQKVNELIKALLV